MPQKPFSTPVDPDIDELLAVLRRRRAPKRIHHIELFLDPEIIEAVDRRYGLSGDLDRSDPFYTLERDIRVHAFLGYDAFHIDFFPFIANHRDRNTDRKHILLSSQVFVHNTGKGRLNFHSGFIRFNFC